MALTVNSTRKRRLPFTIFLLGVMMVLAGFAPLRPASQDDSTLDNNEGRGGSRRLLQAPTPKTADDDEVLDDQQNGRSEAVNPNCTPPAIYDFPEDFMSAQTRRRGGLIIHGLIAAYLFIFLAVICDEYFVPSIKILCENLNLSEDVAGATFMAAATSSPELFINCVGTFVTEGDIGVGTVVGSGVFNILVVPSFCGLFAGKVVELRAWPLTRDSLAYGGSVLLLIGALSDGRVEWFESAAFVLLYALYVALLCCGGACARHLRRLLCCGCCGAGSSGDCEADRSSLGECSPLLFSKKQRNNIRLEIASDPIKPERRQIPQYDKCCIGNNKYEIHGMDEYEDEGLCSAPQGANFGVFCLWLLQRPIKALLFVTVPDCRKRRWRPCYPLTFVVCILWIAAASFVVAWMITVIGDTLQIPDSVMGLTFLAAGTSLPEAVSSVIVTCEGYGEMGISNSIGSNTFNILLCLGLPWLLKSVFFPVGPGQYWININSGGLIYNTISLLGTLFLLYAAFVCNYFRLNRKVGVVTMIMYITFIAFAFAVELNAFGDVNPPTCPH